MLDIIMVEYGLYFFCDYMLYEYYLKYSLIIGSWVNYLLFEEIRSLYEYVN